MVGGLKGVNKGYVEGRNGFCGCADKANIHNLHKLKSNNQRCCLAGAPGGDGEETEPVSRASLTTASLGAGGRPEGII